MRSPLNIRCIPTSCSGRIAHVPRRTGLIQACQARAFGCSNTRSAEVVARSEGSYAVVWGEEGGDNREAREPVSLAIYSKDNCPLCVGLKEKLEVRDRLA